MNEIILRLMNDISALTQPVNPLILKAIFDSSPLNGVEVSAEVSAPHKLLLQLKALTIEYCNLIAELDAHQVNQEKLAALTEENEEVLLKIESLVKKTQISKGLLSTDYSLIEPAANEFLLKQDPLAIPVNFPELNEMQRKFVSEFSTNLEKLCHETEEKKAKLQLVLLTNKLNTLNQELIALGRISTSDISSTQLKAVTASIQAETNKLTRLLDEAVRLQKRFARQLSIAELQLKKDELTLEMGQLEEEQAQIERDFTESELPKEIQSRIRQEFSENSNTFELLASYEGKIDTTLSYINPLSWAAWSTNPQYNEQQEEYVTSFDFLQLLDKQKKLLVQRENLLSAQEQLDSVLPDSHEIQGDEDLKQLIADTINLFNAIPYYSSSTELTQYSPATDFYLTLLTNLSSVSDAVDKSKAALDKLGELLAITLQIEQLRSEYKLNSENENELPSLEEAEKDENGLLYENLLQTEQRLQKRCKRYLINAEQLDVIVQELSSTTINQELLLRQLDSLKEQLLSTEQIATSKNHLDLLLQNIATHIEELSHLPLPHTLQEEVTEPVITAHSEPTVRIVSSSEIDEIQGEELMSEASDIPKAPPSDELIQGESDWSEEAQINSESTISYPGTESNSSEPVSEDSDVPELPVFEDATDFIPIDEAAASPLTTHIEQNNSPAEEESDEYKSLECEIMSVGKSPGRVLSDETAKQTDGVVKNPLPVSANQPVFQNSYSLLALSDGSSQQDSSDDSNFSDDSPFSKRNDGVKDSLNKSLLRTTLDNMENWHQKNTDYLEQQPEDIQKWYDDLYKSIKKSVLSESQCHKASQLLRDILFELQNRKDMSVIRAYMRLCPNPESSLNVLLALKPALLITDDTYNETDELMDCPLELKQHYAHYFKLRNQFPVEAELFLQAIRSVHLIKLYMNIPGRKITSEQIPSFSTDPRYEPLKRHRGFMKVWEQLEDLCRLIFAKFTGQPEHEYAKRPCLFFKPKSAQLIEEADLMIRSIIPEKAP